MTIKTVVLVTDTREQTPLRFANIPSERGTLKEGDYGLKDWQGWAVERKTIQDLVQSVTSQRDRFMREMKRLEPYLFKRLLIVGERAQIEAGAYRSKASPRAILASVATIEARYGVAAVYAKDETEAAAMVENWAFYWAREQIKQQAAQDSAHGQAGGRDVTTPCQIADAVDAIVEALGSDAS